MWFASIWIFTLKLPWQLGAKLFMKYLLDGDAASNTLSWRWVAGMHTNNKPYKASKKILTNIHLIDSKNLLLIYLISLLKQVMLNINLINFQAYKLQLKVIY